MKTNDELCWALKLYYLSINELFHFTFWWCEKEPDVFSCTCH